MYEIKSNCDVIIGKGVALEAGRIAGRRKCKHVTLLVDSIVVDQRAVRSLIESVSGELLKVDLSGEPTYDFLDEWAARCRKANPDCIFGIGGGSVLDLAKAIGVLMINPGRGIDYRGMDKVQRPGIDVFLFPTTAGTGSEATRTASFIDRETQTKLGINGKNIGCCAAFLDPEFTVEAPWKVTQSSGLDVMVHAIEAVSAKNATPYSRLVGSHATALAMKALPRVKEDPKNLEWREKQLLASYYAGVAMFHGQGGIASAISYPLGVHYKVPHGLAGGIFMPSEIEMNVERGFSGYAVCADAIGIGSGEDELERSRLFAEAYRQFHNEVAQDLRLNRLSLTCADLANLKELTLTQRKGCLELNPIECTEKDIDWMLNEAY